MEENPLSELEKEKRRHSENLKEIRKQANVQKLIELVEEAEKEFMNYKTERKNIKDVLYPMMAKSIKKSRLSIGKKITIKNRNIYEFNSGIEAGINEVYNCYKEHEMLENISPEYKDIIREVFEELNKGSRGINRIERYEKGFYEEKGDYYILYRMSRTGGSILNSINLYERNRAGRKSFQKDKGGPLTNQDYVIKLDTKDEEEMELLMKESKNIEKCISKGINDISDGKTSMRKAREILLDKMGEEIISERI